MSRFAQGAGSLVGHIGCQLLVIAAIFFSVWAVNAEADVTDGLFLSYPLTGQTGTATTGAVVTDASGNGRNGTIQGTGGSWLGPDGLQFNGGGPTTGIYVQMPNNIFQGQNMTAITVALDVWVAPGLTGNYFFWNLGNQTGDAGNGHLFSTGNANYRGAISSSNWSNEQSADRSPAAALGRGHWRHIAYSIGGGTGRVYDNGAQVGQNASTSHTPNSVAGTTSNANWVGRSPYGPDNRFMGRVKNFRIYNRALTAPEMCEVAEPVILPNLIADRDALDIGSNPSAVVSNLTLATSGASGAAISWLSSNPAVVSNAGVVTRPTSGNPAASVTLTATVSQCGHQQQRVFNLTVLPASDQGDSEAAAAALALRNLGDVRGNMTLPSTGILGTSVSWSSSAPAVISTSGVVNRPAHGSAAVEVSLTATVTKGSGSAPRVFTATVPPLPEPDESLQAYFFPYMVGEGTATGEQVRFALSQGNNPIQWQVLNSGNPILTSNIGEQGLRDPFIIRSPEGDKFYMLATDLRMYQNSSGSWDQVERTGSRYMMIWESTDLVTWTDRRLVLVAPPSAGNVWAPEAFFDETTGDYVVYWASAIYNQQTDPNHTQNPKPHQRMMHARTRDFHTFTAPQEWINPGYAVIDTTVIKHNDTYYRFTKDERNQGGGAGQGPCGKRVFSDAVSNLLTPTTSITRIADCIGNAGGAGEGPTAFKSNTEDKWYVFIDHFTGGGYRSYESTNPASSTWTSSANVQFPSPTPRHGTVLPITQAEWDRLLSTYQPSAYIASIADTVRTTTPGTAPSLPATVTVTLGNGTTASRAVTWDSVPPSAYAEPGEFEVEGTVPNSYTVKAKAIVTVSAIAVTGLAVNPTSLDLDFGQTQGLQATVSPGNATDPFVAWDSDDDDIAVVNPLAQNGQASVTAVGLGDTVITASAGGGSHTVNIPVSVTAGTEIVVSPVSPTIRFGAGAGVISAAVSSVSSLAPPSGTAEAWIDGELVATQPVVGGLSSLTLPSSLPVGIHEVDVRFTEGGPYRSSSTTAQVSVLAATSSVKLKLKPKKVKVGKRAKLTVTVKSTGDVRGPVTIKIGSKTVKKNLRPNAKGVANFKLPKLKKGNHKITVSYGGSDSALKSKKTVKLKVVNK